jgi:competence protein ComEC
MAIATGSGWWLLDTGPRSPRHDAGARVVLPYLRWAGVRELEGLVLTHADLDHVGGARAVVREVAAQQIYVPVGFGADGGAVPEHDETAEEAARRVIGVNGRVTTLARGARPSRAPPIVVAWPPPVWPAGLARSDNATGLVLVLGRGRARLLALADVDSVIEARLDVAPGVAVMKLGHHGSRSSTGGRTLARLQPHLATISCGRGNPFGHPHPDVLARLAAAAVPCRRTDLEGALWFELSGEEVRDVDWRKASPMSRDACPRAPMTLPRPAD